MFSRPFIRCLCSQSSTPPPHPPPLLPSAYGTCSASNGNSTPTTGGHSFAPLSNHRFQFFFIFCIVCLLDTVKPSQSSHISPLFVFSLRKQRMACREESRSRFHQVDPLLPPSACPIYSSSISIVIIIPFNFSPHFFSITPSHPLTSGPSSSSALFSQPLSPLFYFSSRYYTQTRALRAFASVSAEQMADACSKGCMDCARVGCWSKVKVSAREIRSRQTKIELQRVKSSGATHPDDEEGDHMNLI